MPSPRLAADFLLGREQVSELEHVRQARVVIYFHLGGLEPYSEGIKSA